MHPHNLRTSQVPAKRLCEEQTRTPMTRMSTPKNAHACEHALPAHPPLAQCSMLGHPLPSCSAVPALQLSRPCLLHPR
eukprot:164869-Chlamydomonas_euryale.AAC.3